MNCQFILHPLTIILQQKLEKAREGEQFFLLFLSFGGFLFSILVFLVSLLHTLASCSTFKKLMSLVNFVRISSQGAAKYNLHRGALSIIWHQYLGFFSYHRGIAPATKPLIFPIIRVWKFLSHHFFVFQVSQSWKVSPQSYTFHYKKAQRKDKKSGGQKQFPLLFLFCLFDNWDVVYCSRQRRTSMHNGRLVTRSRDEELMGK